MIKHIIMIKLKYFIKNEEKNLKINEIWIIDN